MSDKHTQPIVTASLSVLLTMVGGGVAVTQAAQPRDVSALAASEAAARMDQTAAATDEAATKSLRGGAERAAERSAGHAQQASDRAALAGLMADEVRASLAPARRAGRTATELRRAIERRAAELREREALEHVDDDAPSDRAPATAQPAPGATAPRPEGLHNRPHWGASP